jgi:uncharacterized damage-inducible protein DinB
MKIQEMQRMFAYNAWATDRTFDALARLSDPDYRRNLKSSHGSLHGTATHLVAAEKIWLSRLVGKPDTALMTEQDSPSMQSLKQTWEEIAAKIARFISKLDDNSLENRLEYATTEGKKFTNTLGQILLHIVNHSSYHRGQIASMMRQIGAEPVNTDMIAFFRHIGN